MAEQAQTPGEGAEPSAAQQAGAQPADESAASADPGTAVPRRDPWKGLRGVMAGTLILEAIVVGLALPVIARLGGGISTVGGVIVIGLAIAMIVAAATLRTGWGLPLALVLQVVMIACVVFQFALGMLGVMFALIWVYILWLRRDLMKFIERGGPSAQ